MGTSDKTAIYQVLVKTLLEVHRTRASVVVRAHRGSEKKQLIIRRGCLAFAESSVPDDHLVRVLVKMGLLPRTMLPKIASLIKEGKTADQAVLEACKLDITEVEKGAREQAVQILGTLFGWEAAEIHCYHADAAPKRQIDLGLPLPELLVLSARRAVSQHTIPSSLKTLRGILAAGPGAAQELLALPLDGAEALAYARLQQPSTLEHLLPDLAIPGISPEELLQRLLLLGFLQLENAPAPVDSGDAALDEIHGPSSRLDDLLGRFETEGLYEILSVPPEATEDEIKAAYYELARLYHPDRFQSKEFSAATRSKADRVFAYITGAYGTLADAARRSSYDEARMKKDGRVEAALQAKTAIDRDREKMAEALYRAGKAAFARGEFEHAAEHLKECVWLRPDTARYRYILGIVQIEMPKMRKEAEQHLLKAIELDRMLVDAYLALGKLYLKVHLPRRAETQLREVLRWDPSNSEAQRLLDEAARAEQGKAGRDRRS